MKKLFNSEYVIEEVIINDELNIGYKLCKKFTFFGVSFCETLDLCYSNASLDESLELFGINSKECKNYPK